MAITGTGTGPFTITGTESSLSIYNYVVAQNAANATKNSDNTQFDFNCVLLVGDGTASTSWTSTEEQVRIDANSFQVRANATLTIGVANPARSGGYWRIQNTGPDQFIINGIMRAYASRFYASNRVIAGTGATAYFEECQIAFLDSIGGNDGLLSPNITYVRCFVAGASAVAVKLAGIMTLNNTKISGSTYALQPLKNGNAFTTYTVTDFISQNNSNDVVSNIANSAILNIVGAFDGAGVPKTGLVIGLPASGNTNRLQWRYSLNCGFSGAGASGVTIRIQNNAPTTVYSGTTDANGNIPQQIFTRVEYINNATAQNRFPYSVIARKYDRSSEAIVWQADNHTSDKIVHAAVPYLTLTAGQAAALTGITLTPSGATNGTATITGTRPSSDLWHFFRQWIATLANFDSSDTWGNDGATIDAGAWNITAGVLTGGLRTTGVITSSLTTGGAYTYSNGILSVGTAVPTLTGGTLNIGASGAYGFLVGLGTTIVSMTPTAPGTYVINGAHTGTLDLRNASVHAITVQVPVGTSTTTAGNVGGAITIINPPVTGDAIVIGAVSGTRMIVRNVTTGAPPVFDAVATGYSNTYVEGTDFSTGDTYSVTVTNVDKLEREYVGIVSASGFTVVVVQENDTVYTANALDGSIYTGINFNASSSDLDLDGSTDPVVLWAEAYARYKYQTTLSGGIALIGAMFAKDQANYLFANTLVINNLDVIPVLIGGDGFGKRRDGASMFGTGNIQIDNSIGVLIAETGVSGLTPAEAADIVVIKTKVLNLPATPASEATSGSILSEVSAVKAKTDQLAFTGGILNANVETMNGAEVIGTGVTGDAWRGVGESP